MVVARVAMRWWMAMMVALVAACTSAGPAATPANDLVGYDVSQDPAVRGQYLVSAVYPDGQGVNLDLVKRRALLRGAEAVRKDGYDLIVWSAPQAVSGASMIGYRSTTGAGQGFRANTPLLGVIYVVRGYSSSGDHPPSARPLATLIDQITMQLAK